MQTRGKCNADPVTSNQIGIADCLHEHWIASGCDRRFRVVGDDVPASIRVDKQVVQPACHGLFIYAIDWNAKNSDGGEAS